MQPGREPLSTTTPMISAARRKENKDKKGSVETQWEEEERGDEVGEDKGQG